MATHSSILARRIPWTEEPGGLQSTESNRTEETYHTYTHRVNNNPDDMLRSSPMETVWWELTVGPRICETFYEL